jgi:hypothetical protein
MHSIHTWTTNLAKVEGNSANQGVFSTNSAEVLEEQATYMFKKKKKRNFDVYLIPCTIQKQS